MKYDLLLTTNIPPSCWSYWRYFSLSDDWLHCVHVEFGQVAKQLVMMVLKVDGVLTARHFVLTAGSWVDH